MNTLENNKLIAEFMQLEKYYDGLEYIKDKCVYSADQLPYSTSWDWLMPVVKKIFTLSFSEVKGLEEEWSNKNKGLFDPDLCGLHSDISTVYNCTVEFIKWYNQNKPKNE